MFKPNAGAVRAISRTILRPQILNAARRLHGQAAQGGSRTNVLGLALTAAGGVGAIAAYQAMGMGKEVQAEVIVPRAKINLEDTSKNKISAQHIQVASSLFTE